MPGNDIIETILRPGQLVAAQYRVDRLIAKGGMAAVWAGTNMHTGKRVALKVILHSFAANAEVTELFRREALSASKVNHPNVVSVFDVIDHEGKTCIVMELLDGETLGRYLVRNGALSLEETLALLLPAMRGVAAANAQGVVHRDLKPANIFLCSGPNGQLLTTKVLDFGISVMMGRVGDTAPATERLAMFGTPAYMAPETIEFSPAIDGRTDVYGFGVLLFEALTGNLPFMGAPGLDLLRRILTEEPPRVTLYRSDLAPDVVNLIACALAKAPNDRFPDMAHLIHAIEDRLLPLLSTPSSLTKISDIFLHPHDESNRNAVAGTEFGNAPLRLVNRSKTRVLYSMKGDLWRSPHGAALAPRSNPSPVATVPRAPPGRPSIAHPLRRLDRRVAVAATFVAFTIGVAWVAIPASSTDPGATPGQSSERQAIAPAVRRPSVTWLPDSPSPPSLPTVPTETIAVAANTETFELRLTAPRPSRQKLHGGSKRSKMQMHRRPPMGPLPDPPAPRTAGRLSLSDF